MKPLLVRPLAGTVEPRPSCDGPCSLDPERVGPVLAPCRRLYPVGKLLRTLRAQLAFLSTVIKLLRVTCCELPEVFDP
jgi:hypothetical protein